MGIYFVTADLSLFLKLRTRREGKWLLERDHALWYGKKWEFIATSAFFTHV